MVVAEHQVSAVGWLVRPPLKQLLTDFNRPLECGRCIIRLSSGGLSLTQNVKRHDCLCCQLGIPTVGPQSLQLPVQSFLGNLNGLIRGSIHQQAAQISADRR